MADLGYSHLAVLPLGRKKIYSHGLKLPTQLAFPLTLISNKKYTKIEKCMGGGQQGVCMENHKIMSLNDLQINDHFFILNWKIGYDLFIRKFMLRHIFALKIIRSSTGNYKTDNMKILRGYIIKSGKVS